MSFMVARMQKMKTGNLVGIGNHNQRLTNNHSNKDIDVERSHLNYDLVNRTDNYKTDIQQFINDNKSSSRAVRKDAVLINEWIITSDNQFFKDKDDKEIKDFFDTAKSYFADKFGDNNIRYAQVHLDETTPHMHLGIVPFNAEHKLTAKTVFNRQALQAIQDELPKYLNERGFELERGEKGSERKNLTVPEYKKAKDELKELQLREKALKQELKDLDDRKETLISQTATLKQDYVQYESVKQKVETTRIDSKPIKEKIGLLKREEVDTGYVKVAKDDFETLKEAYQYMPVAKRELQVAERKADGEYQERLKYMEKYQETAKTLKSTKQELSVLKQFASYVSDFVQKALGIDIFEKFKTHQQEKVQERSGDDLERGR
jgi:hypothetical protein